ncbi:MAG: hypothetical protein BRC23_00500 [Parcubacteria group bacterium SW_4_49_11]|nr:MAG: hypothetical protein BRC23_00500 [Parcubacteria group bacterium SW_4_49_11]
MLYDCIFMVSPMSFSRKKSACHVLHTPDILPTRYKLLTTHMDHNKWKFLESRVAYENPFFWVREDDVINPLGKESKYYVVVKPWAVGIVPMTQENEIVLIGQYRYTTQRFSWEVPAGSADEENEDRVTSARRELWEETGLEAVEWQQLGLIQSFNGNSSEMGQSYLAWDLYDTGEDETEAEGITRIKSCSWDEIKEMIRSDIP